MARNWFEQLLRPMRKEGELAVPPGLYHAMQGSEGQYTRFHLRVERDGQGMLTANAHAAARLSPTGVLIVKGLLDGQTEPQILAQLKRRFRGASEATMSSDIAGVHALIEQLGSPGDSYPVFNLEDAAISPYDTALIAPLQASLPAGNP